MITGDITDEKELGPNPKEVAGPRVLSMMESTAPNPKEVAGHEREGERLKVQV